MDTNAVVEAHIDEGRRLIEQLVRDGIDVTAAFWGVTGEGFIYLYIVSKDVAEAGPAIIYHRVYDALQTIAARHMDVTRVRLVSVTDPIVKEVLGIRRRFPAKIGTWLPGSSLGSTSIEQAYVYPSPEPVRRGAASGERRRLKTAVEQTNRLGELVKSLTAQERHALDQLVSTGLTREQAEYWVRKRREIERPRPPIPAGSVVNARIAAWWGDKPEDDPNPLLQVEAPDGAQGLTFRENTEPA
jgi:hypothetical protein